MITDTNRRWRARLAAAGVLTALAAMGGCSDGGAPSPSDGAGAGVLVSDPVAPAAFSGSAITVTGTALLASPVAYVSMLPGTMPAARTGSISNRRTAAAVTVDFVAGGFDPVAVVAEGGDSLDFTIDADGTMPVRFARGVPREARVRTVRTEPPAGKRDVPLNIRVRVVFSKPVDPATVTSATVGIVQAGTSVGGTAGLSADGLVASFQPATALLPATAYTFGVSSGIRDGDGNPLAAPVAIGFTTESESSMPAVRQVAFVRQSQPGPDGRPGPPSIYVANADGSGATLLTSGWYPALSWDGRRIAFNREDNRESAPGVIRENELWLIDADGSNERRIGTGWRPAWSPDGSEIAFSTGPGGPGDLVVMRLSDLSSRRVLAHDFSGPGLGQALGLPKWLPDGQRISFIRYGDWTTVANQLYIVNADGSEPTPLVPPGPLNCLTCDSMVYQPGYEHSWSPDGSRIAAALTMLINPTATIVTVLGTLDPNGANLRIHRFSAPTPASVLADPDWTPDGRSLVFAEFVPGSGCGALPQCPQRLFIANLDDDSVRQFVPDVPGATPYWDSQVTVARSPQ